MTGPVGARGPPGRVGPEGLRGIPGPVVSRVGSDPLCVTHLMLSNHSLRWLTLEGGGGIYTGSGRGQHPYVLLHPRVNQASWDLLD